MSVWLSDWLFGTRECRARLRPFSRSMSGLGNQAEGDPGSPKPQGTVERGSLIPRMASLLQDYTFNGV